MSTSGQKRTRTERVAALDLPPSRWERSVARLREREMLLRLGLALVAALVIWGVSAAWTPAFSYRLEDYPRRDITARTAFRKPNPEATEQARQRAGSQARAVFRLDPAPLERAREQLRNTVVALLGAESFAQVDTQLWRQFRPVAPPLLAPSAGALAAEPSPPDEADAAVFERFRQALSGPDSVQKYADAVAEALVPYVERGVLDRLPPEQAQANQREIYVDRPGQPELRRVVAIPDVLLGDATLLRQRLAERLVVPEVTELTFAWLRQAMQSTLAIDLDATTAVREASIREVPLEYTTFAVGQTLAKRTERLRPETIDLLKAEHAAYVEAWPLSQRVERSLAVLCLILGLFALCGYYIHFRERRLFQQWHRFATLLGLAIATSAAADLFSGDPWRAEVIPLLSFGLTTAIAYRRDLALLLTLSLVVILVMINGYALGDFLLMMGIIVAAVLLLGRIRSRSKLIKVTSGAGLVAGVLTICLALLDEQPLDRVLWNEAGRVALWTFLTGFLITGMLPMIERAFGVLTDISLLELGDIAHPLLQELVRRAPGTYNHSINVASIGEAAAEAIGAHGLLVRVGAYFHDIGKMFKPAYFVENQGGAANRHDALLPAMSTLVIVAHIKDGADLARQHHLPQPIIDCIEQHHGTTLVEYFFRRASERSEADADGAEVEENLFRYPGPRPQSKETAVLMLADAVESATRSLVEPAPSRIEAIVDEIAMKRLLDGQFDECGLNFRELCLVKESLVKSLTAVYHGRVKYPDQRTA